MKTLAKKKTYKPVLELPPLSAEEHDGLRASIALHGVLVPIMLTEDGRVIDALGMLSERDRYWYVSAAH